MDVFKLLMVLAYAGFGILLLLLAAGRRLPPARTAYLAAKAAFTLAALVIGIHYGSCGYSFVIAVAIGVGIFSLVTREGSVAAGAVMILAVSLAWWLGRGPQPGGWLRSLVFALLIGIGLLGFTRPAAPGRRIWLPAMFALFTAGGFSLIANMTQYTPGSDALKLLVHHQGAYIGPALQVRAGLTPFYDIPLQYGLGPTLSILSVCRNGNCWSGMEFLMVSSTLLTALLILAMALTTHVERGTVWRATVTAAVFAAVFLWPGYPYLGSIPAVAPSVGGLRFLPVTLIAFLLFFRRSKIAAAVLAIAVLWSPETAMMSLCVFGLHEASRVGFVRSAMECLAISCGSLSVFVIVHHVIYGVWVQPDVFAEYILHVPTPQAIDPLSNWLLLVAVCALGAWNVRRQPADVLTFRRDLIVTSLLYGVVSYYLGRSHANNICNLMPFLLLVALRTLDGAVPASIPSLDKLTGLGICGATAALTLGAWIDPPFRHGFSTGIEPVVRAAAQLDGDMLAIRSQLRNPEHLGIADLGHLNRNPVETTVWTPMDPASLWTSVPKARRQLYIRRCAARLRLGGWVILSEEQKEWLNDFRVAYQVLDQRTYSTKSGSYVAARLAPLSQLGLARRSN